MNSTDRMPQDEINEIELQKIKAEIRKLQLESSDFKYARKRSIISTIIVPLLVAGVSGTVLYFSGWFNTQSALITMKQRDLDSLNSKIGRKEIEFKTKDALLEKRNLDLQETLNKLNIEVEAQKELNKELNKMNFSRDATLATIYKEKTDIDVKRASLTDSLKILKHALGIYPLGKEITERLWFYMGELYERDQLIAGLQGQLAKCKADK